VEVRVIDANRSSWNSTLERDATGRPAIRLGLRQARGLSAAGAERLLAARDRRPFSSAQDLAERAELDEKDLEALAGSDALYSIAGNRHRARWSVAGIQEPTELLDEIRITEGIPMLRPPTEGENVVADYRHLGFSMHRHPLALLREKLAEHRIRPARAVFDLKHGDHVRAAGLVITRQRPSSAAGVTFLTLEDETGHLNLVVWEALAKRQRRVLLKAALLGVRGKVQREGGVLHVIAERLYDHRALLGALVTRSRGFHGRGAANVRPSNLVVLEILEIALRAFFFHQLFEPSPGGLLATELRHQSIGFELVDQLLDVDLDRRVADVVGNLFDISFLSLFRFFLEIVFVVRLNGLHRRSPPCQELATSNRNRRCYKPKVNPWQYLDRAAVNYATAAPESFVRR
jgi:hypothetical protein